MSDKPDYLDDLILQLRLLDVPGERIGQIVAEAEDHLAASGETPEEAFGPMAAFARQLADRELSEGPHEPVGLFRSLVPRSASEWGTTAVTVLLSLVGAGGVTTGVLALTVGTGTWFGLPAWLHVVVGALVLVVLMLRLRGMDDPIIDPRTGKRVNFDRRGRRKSSERA